MVSRSRVCACLLSCVVVLFSIAGAPPAIAQSALDALKGLGGLGQSLLNRPSFSDADEEKMAQANAGKFEAANKMWQDPLLDAYLTGLTQKVLAGAHPRPFTYRIRVVNDGSINAFTFGGGLLYIHAGLLARMENEAQFVMVLAHEIAHVTQRHIPRGIEGRYGIQVLGQIAASAASARGAASSIPPDLLAKTYEYSMNAAVSGHGRSHETEADVVGLDYMVKAGYDPREAPKTFQVLLQEYGDQPLVKNFFYGSHPTNQARIAHLSSLVQSKYAADIKNRTLLVNSDEYRQRTRALVVVAGQHNYQAKRYNTAAALFKRALEAKDNDPLAHYYLGKIAIETGGAGAADQAIEHFSAALKVNQNYVEPWRELGLAYYRKNDKANALHAFERYLALAPGAPDAAPIRGYVDELRTK
jgi:predicted Zn-dependent protease